MSNKSPHDPNESIQSQGGKARAEKLSPEVRSRIASEAAAARWNIPKASHGGVIKIGPWANIQCFNVEHEGEVMRLISQRSFLKMLGVDAGNNAAPKRLNHLLDNPSLRSKGIRDLMSQIASPVKFIHDGFTVFGYDGKIIVEYCKALMEARRVGGLPEYADDYADACERIVVSLAGVAIAALIDEATGYQEFRAKNALSKILEQYIAEELQDTASRFPEEFYKQIYRLRGWDWNSKTKFRRPKVVAMWTVHYIYKRLPPGVYEELVRKNPKDGKGRRSNKHYQWLSGDVGDPRLITTIDGVTRMMRGSSTWGEMKRFVNKFYPMIETSELGFEIERKTKEDYEFTLGAD